MKTMKTWGGGIFTKNSRKQHFKKVVQKYYIHRGRNPVKNIILGGAGIFISK